jgi:cardiolipin synthase
MFDGWTATTFFLLELASRLLMTCWILLRGKGRPEARIAWIVVVLAVPLLGITLYLLVGEARLGRQRAKRYRNIVERLRADDRRWIQKTNGLHPSISRDFKPLATLIETVGQFASRGGNDMRLITDTDMFVQSLVEDIDRASSHCHLEFYIFLVDHSGRRIAEALERAARRGVTCRLLVDGVGSRPMLKSGLCEFMRKAGVAVVEALPVNLLRLPFSRVDLRNHRKLAVIDGKIGYVGSHNIADAAFAIKPKYAPWVDASARVVGPIVHDLQELFIEDWYLDTDESLEPVLDIEIPAALPGIAAQVMGTGPTTQIDSMHQVIQTACHTARQEIIFTTPYFVPDEGTVNALRIAAGRGVDTMLVVPMRSDSRLAAAAGRSHYATLLDSGVKIFKYTKGLLHAKTMTVDTDLALITTANLDRRSFDLNFELSLMVYDDDLASQLRFVQRAYIADSVPLTRQSWMRRPWPQRLADNMAGVLSPLL